MKLLRRSPKRLLVAFLNLPGHIVASFRCVALFRQPIGLLLCYIRRQNPKSSQVQLRNGVVLHLSKDHSDIVTVYLTFCRRDYGVINAGTSIIDIGANIGVFSVYAALGGAVSVQAYEPAQESFDLLKHNILCNGLEEIITPHKAAVVGEPSEPILFPKKSSVFNSVQDSRLQGSDDYASVPAIPLSKAVETFEVPSLIKMDCEGGEYDIILNTEPVAFERIDEIRLEYHRGPKDQLFSRFKELGYVQHQFMDEGEGGGYVWARKALKQ